MRKVYKNLTIGESTCECKSDYFAATRVEMIYTVSLPAAIPRRIAYCFDEDSHNCEECGFSPWRFVYPIIPNAV